MALKTFKQLREELLYENKDACYYKVKSRYKVWPSAYASGALVQCRKVGADKWGNDSKNEDTILDNEEQIDEDLRKWFKDKWVRFGPDGKIRGDCAREDDTEGKPKCLPQSKAHSLGKEGRASAAARKRREDPNPERSGPAINVSTNKEEVEDIFDLIEDIIEDIAKENNVDSEVIWEDLKDITDEELLEVAAWQRKEGKNPEGGLNAKGIASYRRENPGSKLQMAVTTKPSKLKPGSKAANRRKSFCARMGGMKKRLTSAKTARDPDSRINKALRKWNC